MELYDVRALETRAELTKSLFDTYTRMAYTRYEREQLIINGIGLAIVTFVAQYQARLVFSVPLRPALARIYDSLLKNMRIAYIICTTKSLLRKDYMSSKYRLLTAESHPTPMSIKERHQREMQAFHEEWLNKDAANGANAAVLKQVNCPPVASIPNFHPNSGSFLLFFPAVNNASPACSMASRAAAGNPRR